jgi:acyl-CoA thioester hydrolase
VPDSDLARLLRELPLAKFPSTVTLRPRFRDLDMLDHLNNVAIADYYFDVRVRYIRELSQHEASAGRLLVRRLELDYLGEGSYPEELQFGSGITSVGRTSVTLGTAMHQHGRCIGTCVCVLVATGEGGTVPLADGLRPILQAHLLTA